MSQNPTHWPPEQNRGSGNSGARLQRVSTEVKETHRTNVVTEAMSEAQCSNKSIVCDSKRDRKHLTGVKKWRQKRIEARRNSPGNACQGLDFLWFYLI